LVRGIYKQRLSESTETAEKQRIINQAIGIYEETLKLLHPFMPFVTERSGSIWATGRPVKAL